MEGISENKRLICKCWSMIHSTSGASGVRVDIVSNGDRKRYCGLIVEPTVPNVKYWLLDRHTNDRYGRRGKIDITLWHGDDKQRPWLICCFSNSCTLTHFISQNFNFSMQKISQRRMSGNKKKQVRLHSSTWSRADKGENKNVCLLKSNKERSSY